MTHNTDNDDLDSDYIFVGEVAPLRIIPVHSPTTDKLLGWVKIYHDDEMVLVKVSDLEEENDS